MPSRKRKGVAGRSTLPPGYQHPWHMLHGPGGPWQGPGWMGGPPPEEEDEDEEESSSSRLGWVGVGWEIISLANQLSKLAPL